MKQTKHIEVKAFAFFIISISSGYYDKMKTLIMGDTFVPDDVHQAEKRREKYEEGYNSDEEGVNYNELDYNLGDYLHLVDVYRQFIEEYLPDVCKTALQRN